MKLLFLKRPMDVAGALAGLALLSPVFITTGFLVRRRLGSPVLYAQTRPGQHGKSFRMVKFRSMTNARDANGELLPDEQRMTPFGDFLRRTSLDELPELLCVLKGDMSLVGPRPLLMRYLSRYTPEQARRNELKPGITGWAQVNGRNANSWEEKFRLDTWYVENQSFWLDIKILAKTLWVVLKREGVSQEGMATAEEFMGIPVLKNGG